MRTLAAPVAILALVSLIAGCGGDDREEETGASPAERTSEHEGTGSGSPTLLEIEVAPQLEAGKQVAAQSGCLACHQFFNDGNSGPGPELTHIGAELSRAAIARSLVVGPGIMPSYRQLKERDPEKFQELTLFLASLNSLN